MRHLMKTSVLILIAFAAILAVSSTTEAINPNEFERAYFASNTNPGWTGSYHRLCDGTRYIEGTLDGGFMMLVTFPCNGGGQTVDCFVRICDPIQGCSGPFEATACPNWAVPEILITYP